MRLIGIRRDNVSQVAVLDGDQVRPVATLDEFWADPQAALERAASQPGDPINYDEAARIPPVPPSARVLCLGLNYREHAAEGKFDVPTKPTIFGRWTASLSVDGEPAEVPVDERGLDWEGEIAAWVGAPLKNVSADEARAGVLGYSTFNDLSARRAQKMSRQWTLGKNADKSGPIGPIVTADEVGDLRDGLRVVTRVNGTVVQDGNSADMIFEVGEVLATISRTMTLNPGDIIVTGTPSGVGYVRTPPWLLTSGDVVEVEVDRLGTLRTPIA